MSCLGKFRLILVFSDALYVTQTIQSSEAGSNWNATYHWTNGQAFTVQLLKILLLPENS
jgi:hypothetical protein